MTGTVDAPDWSTLPAPIDDGATRHLTGSSVPPIPLPATDGRTVDLSAEPGLSVVYAYPRTGVPDKPNPDGWDAIPGARGCSPQSCAFRDHFDELRRLGVSGVFGLSTQDTEYQREAARRLHLPFPILSDGELLLTRAMTLPTFQVQDRVLLKRFTLLVRNGTVEHVSYPVFPPDRNASDVAAFLARGPWANSEPPDGDRRRF